MKLDPSMIALRYGTVAGAVLRPQRAGTPMGGYYPPQPQPVHSVTSILAHNGSVPGGHLTHRRAIDIAVPCHRNMAVCDEIRCHKIKYDGTPAMGVVCAIIGHRRPFFMVRGREYLSGEAIFSRRRVSPESRGSGLWSMTNERFAKDV